MFIICNVYMCHLLSLISFFVFQELDPALKQFTGEIICGQELDPALKILSIHRA